MYPFSLAIAPIVRRRIAVATTLAATLLVAAGLAACGTTDPVAPRPSGQQDPGAPEMRPIATTTLAWNALARTLIERNQPNQQAALRALAYSTLAADQSVLAIDSALRGVAVDSRGRQALVRTAIAAASAEVLRAFFPRDLASIDQLEQETPGTLPTAGAAGDGSGTAIDGSDRLPHARAIGAQVGAHVLARARGDRFDAVWTGTVPSGTGIWASAFNPARPPLLPLLGQARTFYMSRGDQFRAPPPPALRSQEFADALAEVRRISDSRTPEQVRIAQAWAMTTGSLAAGYWNAVADTLITRHRLPESEAAHVLALANTAAWDANVACHDTKYAYWLARPTQIDPQITLAIGLPNHPSYPSNHACLSGAAAEILADRFPTEAAELRARAVEAMTSRIYAGVHYRFDGDAGLQIARKVSALALAMNR